MSLKIFDKHEAMERIGDEKLIYELLDDIVELAEESDEKISKGMANNDFEAILIASHTLKGTAANLALHQLSEAGSHFENDAKNQDSSRFPEYYDILKTAINNFKEFLANK